MKKLVSLVILAVALCSIAAISATVTTKLARIQTDPNSSDDPLATAYFSQTTTVGEQTFEARWVSVSWKLKDTTKSVTVNGKTMLYAEVSQFVTAIADQEYAATLAK